MGAERGGRTVRRQSERQAERALLDASLELFARDGIHAVSQRAIVKAAGVSSQYAIHYYFGGKQGLIKALLYDVVAPLREAQSAALGALEAAGAKPAVRTILQAAFDPHFEAARRSRQGQDAARLLARMSSELGTEGHRLLGEAFGDVFERTVALLASAVPEKPLPLLRLRLILAIANVFHGIVEVAVLNDLPGETIRYAPVAASELHDSLLYGHFIDYLTNGISGP